MNAEKRTAPAGNVVIDKAAEIVCAWLARRGCELIETTEAGLKREWNCGMEIRRSPGKSVHMDKMLPTWNWAGSRRTPGEAWLTVADWLFGLSREGPSWVQVADESRPSPGRVVLRRKRFPVPKFRFSSLEEFVLKASVLPDFRENAQ